MTGWCKPKILHHFMTNIWLSNNFWLLQNVKIGNKFDAYLLFLFFKSRPINLAHLYATFSTSQYIDGKKSRNTWNFKIRYRLLLNVSIVKPNFNNTMKSKQHKWVFVLFTLICCYYLFEQIFLSINMLGMVLFFSTKIQRFLFFSFSFFNQSYFNTINIFLKVILTSKLTTHLQTILRTSI